MRLGVGVSMRVMVGAWVPKVVAVTEELVFSLQGWERPSLLRDASGSGRQTQNGEIPREQRPQSYGMAASFPRHSIWW